MSPVQGQVTQLQSKSCACKCDTTKRGCSLGVWKAAFWKPLDTWKLQYSGSWRYEKCLNPYLEQTANLKTRLSPLCARGRDDDKEEVSDVFHLV